MRINKYVAQATGLSRRDADHAISQGRVNINSKLAKLGDEVITTDKVTLDQHPITSANKLVIILNKPTGYVTSRDGQGAPTVYELLPEQYHSLKPVGRLDKDSSGLLILTNDGDLANKLTHPSYNKLKVYEIEINKPLTPQHLQTISDKGVELDDGFSRLELNQMDSTSRWQVTMSEGRNRQIRRTFQALGYKVTKLHRVQFGEFTLDNLTEGGIKKLNH